MDASLRASGAAANVPPAVLLIRILSSQPLSSWPRWYNPPTTVPARIVDRAARREDASE
jgi:hypothetical protein